MSKGERLTIAVNTLARVRNLAVNAKNARNPAAARGFQAQIMAEVDVANRMLGL